MGLKWGAGHRESFGRFFNHEIWFSVQAEDLPLYENRVELDPERTDTSGLPGVRLHWDLHPNDRRLVEFGMERARELAAAAGASELQTTRAADPNPGWHLLGTCRMGDDPATSVVDADHQAWDVPNLYICDGSSFVTGGAVNPTSTIGALALRCADRILARKGVAGDALSLYPRRASSFKSRHSRVLRAYLAVVRRVAVEPAVARRTYRSMLSASIFSKSVWIMPYTSRVTRACSIALARA